MSPSQIGTVRKEFATLWPQSRLNDVEWSVVIEKADRIDIATDQASAALRNMKANMTGCPSVAELLAALRGAQVVTQTPAMVGVAPVCQGRVDADWTDDRGLTTFECRVIDDPKFHDFAKKIGRLDAGRLRDIRRRAGIKS